MVEMNETRPCESSIEPTFEEHHYLLFVHPCLLENEVKELGIECEQQNSPNPLNHKEQKHEDLQKVTFFHYQPPTKNKKALALTAGQNQLYT